MMQLETFFTVPEQTRLLIFAVLLGIPLGVVFDVLRTLRLLLPHGKLARSHWRKGLPHLRRIPASGHR